MYLFYLFILCIYFIYLFIYLILCYVFIHWLILLVGNALVEYINQRKEI